MATRQYVGARYVPKFATPTEWQNNVAYEALTIVTYMNSSYTSKIPVPPGIVPTNEQYWARTGDYNAQVEQYRQEVEKISDSMEILNDYIVNVKNFGAKGDGVTNDSPAIAKAIASMPNGGCLCFPNGTYIITQTIVADNIEIKLDGFATLKAGANVNIVELRPNSRITGGTINTQFTGYNQTAIYLNGTYKFGGTEKPSRCSINAIKLEGNYSGYGIYLHAPVQPSTSSFIQGLQVSDVKIYMYSTGIRLNPAKGGATSPNPTWTNGNYFDNIWLEGCRIGIQLQNQYIPSECSGNIFTNIGVQPYAAMSTNAVICEGNLNVFDIFVWDWGAGVSQNAFYINGDYNRIKSNLAISNYTYYVINGQLNHIESFDNFVMNPPNGSRTRHMTGDQDDYLFQATKKFTVTGANITNMANMFNRAGGSVATVAANTPVSVLIEMDNAPLRDAQYIGVMFGYNSISTGVTIEIFYDGSYKTIFNVSNNKRQYVYVPITAIPTITKIRISFNSTIPVQISRIFAMDTWAGGDVFLENYGATYKGNLHFAKGNGVTMEDVTSGTYYQLYVDGGTLKVKAL